MGSKRLHHLEITANSFFNCLTSYTMPFKLGGLVYHKTIIEMCTIRIKLFKRRIKECPRINTRGSPISIYVKKLNIECTRKEKKWQARCKIAKSITEINVIEMIKYKRTGLTKIFFRRDVIAVMVKARGDERGNACSFIRTLPQGVRNDWLLKERLD